MKRKFIILFAIICGAWTSAQDHTPGLLIKDLDLDNIADTIWLDTVNSVISCKLSSLQFKTLSSKQIHIGDVSTFMGSHIEDSEQGFLYAFDWMRAGCSSEFIYEKSTKRIRIIGLSSYYYGNAIGDGRHETSLDLLNGEFHKSSDYYDYEKDTLIQNPAIDKVLALPSIYIEDYDNDTLFNLLGE